MRVTKVIVLGALFSLIPVFCKADTITSFELSGVGSQFVTSTERSVLKVKRACLEDYSDLTGNENYEACKQALKNFLTLNRSFRAIKHLIAASKHSQNSALEAIVSAAWREHLISETPISSPSTKDVCKLGSNSSSRLIDMGCYIDQSSGCIKC